MSQSADSFGPWINALGWVWDTNTLTAELATQAGGGGGGDASAANQLTEIARLTSILAQFDVALSTRLAPADTLAAVTALGSITNALPAGTNAIGKLAANAGVNIGSVDIAAPTTVINGKKTVTTAGTRVTLAASTTVKGVTVKALAANTGLIYVGDTSVASTNGFQLSASESVSMDIANLNTVNLDAAVNGEGVTFIAVN